MTDTSSPQIQIPGVDDYSFVLPDDTEQFLPTESTLRFTGDSPRTVALTNNSAAVWRDAAPASTPGRIVNSIAEAMAVGWLATVEYGPSYISAVLTPPAEALAAHLWLLSDQERIRDSRWGVNSRGHFAVRLGWSRESEGWRFDQAWSTTCRISADQGDGTLFVRWAWDVRRKVADQYNLRDLREYSQSFAPATVVAGQADRAVAKVQAAADDAAYEAAAAEYEATGRSQFDGLRDALSEFIAGATDAAEQRRARAGETFSNGNDVRAEELRTEAEGIRKAARYAQSVLECEGQRNGTTVDTLGDCLADTLSALVAEALSDFGPRGRESRSAYEAIGNAVRRVATVSSPTVVVAVG